MKKNPKEYEALTKEYFKVTAEKGLSKNLCNYVWNVLVATSRGYGFNLSHTLAYSLVALQEMNLAFRFPIIYWNCACLITNSGALEINSDEDEDDDEETTSTDYAKTARALGEIISAGIKVSPVDINKSAYGFRPDVENNEILFGMKALLNVNDELVADIIAKRPFYSPKDFYYKVKPKKQAMISLIKAGAFDNLMERKKCMAWFIWETCDKKSKLNLQNMATLLKYNLIPQDNEDFIKARRIYEFNRYLKAKCKVNYLPLDYGLDNRAIQFLLDIEQGNLIENDNLLNMKKWDKFYQKSMDIFRNWIKDNQESILTNLNEIIFLEDWDKYAKGNYSSWEMETMCFYYHEHELANVNYANYGLSNFFDLPQEPEIDTVYNIRGKIINIFKLSKICGTCIAKNKNKSSITLLTREGIVNVKFPKAYFNLFDKQISEKQEDDKKKIMERSWFNRGSILVIMGIRSGDDFIPKKYSKSIGHQLYKVLEITKNNELIMTAERYKGENGE